jgi:hypothetical protein
MARAAPDRARAPCSNRPVWPITNPAGKAMMAASATASREYWRCSSIRCRMPVGPHQCSAVVSHPIVSLTVFIGAPPGPGSTAPTPAA